MTHLRFILPKPDASVAAPVTQAPSPPAAPGTWASDRTRTPPPKPFKQRPVPAVVLQQFELNDRLSVLQGEQAAYAMSPSICRAANSKLHLALPLGHRVPVVVEEIRLSAKTGGHANNGAKTLPMALADVTRLAEHQAWAQIAEYSHPASFHVTVLPDGQKTWQRFVAAGPSSLLSELIVDTHYRDKMGRPAPKAYITANLAIGYVDTLLQMLGPFSFDSIRQRSALARNFAYQLFAQLNSMQAAGYSDNFEFNLDTIFVAENGAFSLANFGTARHLNFAGAAIGSAARYGSVATPDHFTYACRAHAAPQKTNICTAWVLTLQILSGFTDGTPFQEGPQETSLQSGDSVAAPPAAAAWQNFYFLCNQLPRNIHGQIIVPRPQYDSSQMLGSNHAGIDLMLQRAIACDAELVEIGLRYGMQAEPERRCDAGLHVRLLAPLLGAVTEADSELLRSRVDALSAINGHRGYSNQLWKYAALCDEQAELLSRLYGPTDATAFPALSPQRVPMQA